MFEEKPAQGRKSNNERLLKEMRSRENDMELVGIKEHSKKIAKKPKLIFRSVITFEGPEEFSSPEFVLNWYLSKVSK